MSVVVALEVMTAVQFCAPVMITRSAVSVVTLRQSTLSSVDEISRRTSTKRFLDGKVCNWMPKSRSQRGQLDTSAPSMDLAACRLSVLLRCSAGGVADWKASDPQR